MTLRRRQSLITTLVATLIGTLAAVTSCGFFRDAGAELTQQRQIQGVTAVRLLTSGDLTITAGPTQTLTVTAGTNQQVGLTSQVIDGTLILDSKAGSVSGSISYALTVPPLRSVDLTGSGNAHGVAVLAGDAEVTVTGSGNASLSGLDLTSVVVDLSGSGEAELQGRSVTQRVSVSGSGSYRGAALVTDQSDVQVSGSGGAAVQATRRLTASVSGSGDVTFTGNPPELIRNATGSGSINAG